MLWLILRAFQDGFPAEVAAIVRAVDGISERCARTWGWLPTVRLARGIAKWTTGGKLSVSIVRLLMRAILCASLAAVIASGLASEGIARIAIEAGTVPPDPRVRWWLIGWGTAWGFGTLWLLTSWSGGWTIRAIRAGWACVVLLIPIYAVLWATAWWVFKIPLQREDVLIWLHSHWLKGGRFAWSATGCLAAAMLLYIMAVVHLSVRDSRLVRALGRLMLLPVWWALRLIPIALLLVAVSFLVEEGPRGAFEKLSQLWVRVLERGLEYAGQRMTLPEGVRSPPGWAYALSGVAVWLLVWEILGIAAEIAARLLSVPSLWLAGKRMGEDGLEARRAQARAHHQAGLDARAQTAMEDAKATAHAAQTLRERTPAPAEPATAGTEEGIYDENMLEPDPDPKALGLVAQDEFTLDQNRTMEDLDTAAGDEELQPDQGPESREDRPAQNLQTQESGGDVSRQDPDPQSEERERIRRREAETRRRTEQQNRRAAAMEEEIERAEEAVELEAVRSMLRSDPNSVDEVLENPENTDGFQLIDPDIEEEQTSEELPEGFWEEDDEEEQTEEESEGGDEEEPIVLGEAGEQTEPSDGEEDALDETPPWSADAPIPGAQDVRVVEPEATPTVRRGPSAEDLSRAPQAEEAFDPRIHPVTGGRIGGAAAHCVVPPWQDSSLNLSRIESAAGSYLYVYGARGHASLGENTITILTNAGWTYDFSTLNEESIQIRAQYSKISNMWNLGLFAQAETKTQLAERLRGRLADAHVTMKKRLTEVADRLESSDRVTDRRLGATCRGLADEGRSESTQGYGTEVR